MTCGMIHLTNSGRFEMVSGFLVILRVSEWCMWQKSYLCIPISSMLLYHTASIIALDAGIRSDLLWWIMSNQSEPNFSPDWSLGSMNRGPISLELPSYITSDSGIQGNYTGSATELCKLMKPKCRILKVLFSSYEVMIETVMGYKM